MHRTVCDPSLLPGVEQIAPGAVRKPRPGICLLLKFDLDSDDLIAQALLSFFVSHWAQSLKDPYASMLYIDDAVACGVDGDAWNSRAGHGSTPLSEGRDIDLMYKI
jgi:hypothetical protein